MTEPLKDVLAREARHVRRLGWILSVLTAVLIVVLAMYVWPLLRARFSDGGGVRPIEERGPLMAFERVTVDVVKRARPSVVYITTETQTTFRGRGRPEPQIGSGSGFIWDEQGRIVTNYHVIQNASVAHVVLFDQTTYDAEVVGVSVDHDLAVLKISVPLGVRLVPIPLGRSNNLEVGQAAFAIGNPYGLESTVTTGIVSAVGRSIMSQDRVPIEDVIQTDAAINPGNSGGPLLDSAARLIGVNTAIFSPSGTSSGIGFAIPVDTANRVIPQIIATGKYQRSWIGVVSADESMRQYLNPAVPGIVIREVQPGSPADRAGLTGLTMSQGRNRGRRPVIGDIITHMNDKPVKTLLDLYSVMDRTPPGSKVNVTLWKEGAIRQVEIVTQETPAMTENPDR